MPHVKRIPPPLVSFRLFAAGKTRTAREKNDRAILKLLQEPHVVLIKLADVGDAVAAGADALDAEAEGKAGDTVGVVADRAQHVGVDHAGRFARDAQVPEAVGPIAGDFQIDGQVAADRGGLFVIEPRHHQPHFQLRRRHVELDVLFEPIPGNEHRRVRDEG